MYADPDPVSTMRPSASYVAAVPLTVMGWFSTFQVRVVGVLVSWLPFFLQAEIGIGMSARPADNFGKPRRGSQYASRGNPAILESRKAGLVDGVSHAEVFGFNHQEARAGYLARRLGRGRRSLNGCLLRCPTSAEASDTCSQKPGSQDAHPLLFSSSLTTSSIIRRRGLQTGFAMIGRGRLRYQRCGPALRSFGALADC